MKVLFILPEIVWYRIPLFTELSKLIDVKYLFTKVDFSEGDYVGINVQMEDLKDLDYEVFHDRHKVSFKAIRKVWSGKYDIVVVPAIDSKDQKMESLLCAIVAKIKKKKTAFFWEKWVDKRQFLSKKSYYKQKLQNVFVRFHSLFIDCYLVPGNATRKYYQTIGIPDAKCHIVRNASAVQLRETDFEIRKTYKIPKDAIIILYFGRIIRLKGLDILIKAFEKIVKERNVYLLVCGDGDFREECEEYIHKNKIKNVIFTGMIQTNDRQPYYEQSDIFVLPNRFLNQNDAWGLSVNEAMQFGKPVIVSEAIGAAYDLVRNGENGYIVIPGNVDSLYQAINQVLEENRLKEMGENSLNIIRDYSYQNQARLFIDAMKSI